MDRLKCVILTAVLLAGPSIANAQAPGTEAAIERAKQALEADRVADALQILQALAKRPNVEAETLVLLSTAQFMIGETEGGRATLERALEIDPLHRQAWLNRAALDIAEDRHDEALGALRKAQEIDPEATDNELNIGAVYVLKGDIGQASRQFNCYLSQNRSSADAYYLVASNYTLASRWDLAVQHLEAAIRLDERSRRRARVDPNFRPLGGYQPFLALLETDSYRMPDGAHQHREMFDAPYDGSHGDLLKAVLNALQFAGQAFDPNVEVTEQWALVWSDMRLKLSNSAGGGGRIEMSAPADRMTVAQWERRRDALIAEIHQQLARLTMRRP
jgi:tetratricopeptide (TPR) repeat protein